MTGGTWQGPSSESMAASAATYVDWMHTTAAQAEDTAAQAKAAIAAYEAAFAATVPPPVIEANRALLAMLVATNILGQNTPAIAATETHYMEMWAQDATAMYGYAGSAASASVLTPFAEPPQTTNPAGTAQQSAAAAQAGTSGASNIGTEITQLINSLPTALQNLANGLVQSPTTGSTNLLSGLSLPQLASLTLPAGTADRPDELEHDLLRAHRSVFAAGLDVDSWRPVPVVRPGVLVGPERAGRRRVHGRSEADQRGPGAAGRRAGATPDLGRVWRRAGVGVDGPRDAGRKHVGAAGVGAGGAGDPQRSHRRCPPNWQAPQRQHSRAAKERSSARWRCRALPDGPSPRARTWLDSAVAPISSSAGPGVVTEVGPRVRRPQSSSDSRRSKTDKARVFEHVLRSVSTGDQLGPDVHRRGIGPVVGRSGRVGRARRRIAAAATSYSSVISIPDQRTVVGSDVTEHGGRGRPISDLDAGHRHAGRRDRGPGHRGRQRLRDGLCVTRAAGGNRRQPRPIGLS